MKEKFKPQDWLQNKNNTDITPQSSQPSLNLSAPTGPDSVSTDFDLIISRLEAAQTDITANYSDWRDIGFAFADKFGEVA